MTVSFQTLGCKLNFAETSTVSRLFAESGYTKVDFGEPSDVVVINSCTVTAQADKKCRQAISRAVKTSPSAVVVVMGCFAELKAEEIRNIPGVDLVLGNRDKFNVIRHIDRFRGLSGQTREPDCEYDAYRHFFGSYSLFDRTRSFLKVQDGCDYRCTYCTIPKARGHSRNASVADIMEQARLITGQGVKEIVLAGVNIGDFGRTTGENLVQLLHSLDNMELLERIRIGSVEPNLVTEEMIALIANSQKFAAHFHIPLQSGCNKILGLMGRRYRRELFVRKTELIYRHIPHAAVGTDVIVGFPGETDDDFDDTFTFIQQLDLAYLHVFTYSERPGTKAVDLPGKVNRHDAELRSRSLIELSAQKRKCFYEKHIGCTSRVLFEQREKSGIMTGFTGNYIKVGIPYHADLTGKNIEVKLTGIGESGDMTGRI